jgi:hypothetical protein
MKKLFVIPLFLVAGVGMVPAGIVAYNIASYQWTASRQKTLMPAEETALIAASQRAQKIRSSGNELRYAGARSNRAKEICAAMRPGSVQNWIGTVRSLSTNNAGHGYVGIDIGPEIELRVINAFAPSSAQFQASLPLREGDLVKFSGRFFPSDEDCLEERSMTLSGSLRNPEFRFELSEVAKTN